MGRIINGVYYKDGGEPSIQAPIGRQLRSYELESQANIHDVDLIQPYDRNGNLNPEFFKYYPETAKDYGYEA